MLRSTQITPRGSGSLRKLSRCMGDRLDKEKARVGVCFSLSLSLHYASFIFLILFRCYFWDFDAFAFILQAFSRHLRFYRVIFDAACSPSLCLTITFSLFNRNNIFFNQIGIVPNPNLYHHSSNRSWHPRCTLIKVHRPHSVRNMGQQYHACRMPGIVLDAVSFALCATPHRFCLNQIHLKTWIVYILQPLNHLGRSYDSLWWNPTLITTISILVFAACAHSPNATNVHLIWKLSSFAFHRYSTFRFQVHIRWVFNDFITFTH